MTIPGPIPDVGALAIHNDVVDSGQTFPWDVAVSRFAEQTDEVRATSVENQGIVRGGFATDLLTCKPSSGNYALEGWVIDLGSLGDLPLSSVTYSYQLFGSGAVYTEVEPSPSSLIVLPELSVNVFAISAVSEGPGGAVSFDLVPGYNVTTYATRVRPPEPNEPVEPGDITEGTPYSFVGSNTRPLKQSEFATLSNGQVRLLPLLVTGSAVEIKYQYALRPSLS